MGHSPSIGDLKKNSTEFSSFIESCKTNLQRQAAPLEKNFLIGIDDMYNKNKWEQIIMGQGSYMDYRQQAEFSLSSIKTMIENITKSVFQGGLPPEGTTIEKVAKAAEIGVSLLSYEALALCAAKAFITNALGVFEVKTSTSFNSITKSAIIAPGLMLHVWKYNDSFHQKDYFNNEYILGTCLNFKIIYSFDQGKVEQDIEYLNKHTVEIRDTSDAIVQLQKNINKMLIDGTPMAEVKEYKERITFSKEMLEEYRDEVKKLVNEHKRSLLAIIAKL